MSIVAPYFMVELGYRRSSGRWSPAITSETWLDLEPVLDGLVLNDNLEY